MPWCPTTWSCHRARWRSGVPAKIFEDRSDVAMIRLSAAEYVRQRQALPDFAAPPGLTLLLYFVATRSEPAEPGREHVGAEGREARGSRKAEMALAVCAAGRQPEESS